MRFTGKPSSAVLRYEGTDLANMPDGTPSPWEVNVHLPSEYSSLDIEAEITWDSDSPENAVTLTLEPPSRESRSETQWTGSNSSLLHTIFTFKW